MIAGAAGQLFRVRALHYHGAIVSHRLELQPAEYQLMLRLSEALHGSLDLHTLFANAVPLLQELVQVEHMALAMSRPGTLYDYEWISVSLPEQFLAQCTALADHDFVRDAVVVRPNIVLRDHEMITRAALQSHVMYSGARALGLPLEHVMAVMLTHHEDWSSGLSFYRSGHTPFSDHEAAILQMVVPHIRNAVCNAREHLGTLRETWLEPTLEGSGIAVLWLEKSGREITRTAHATRLLEQFFAKSERGSTGVPEVLLQHLRSFLASEQPDRILRPWTTRQALCALHVTFVPMQERAGWALLLRTSGIDLELQRKLSPRLSAIAGDLVSGLSNEEISRKYQRSLATIKQQVSEVFARLGVDGRKGLLRLVSGQGQSAAADSLLSKS